MNQKRKGDLAIALIGLFVIVSALVYVSMKFDFQNDEKGLVYMDKDRPDLKVINEGE